MSKSKMVESIIDVLTCLANGDRGDAISAFQDVPEGWEDALREAFKEKKRAKK